MQQIKLIQDSNRFTVTSVSPNFVQGIRLSDSRVVTFCRFSGKIVKNCLVVEDNQAHNHATIGKTGFVFLSLLLLVMLFVSCGTGKNADFKNTQVKNVITESVHLYTVKKGDNLSKVFGYKKGMMVCAKNKLKNCDLIFPDQKLKF